MTSTTNPTTTETSMTITIPSTPDLSDIMPYHWEMFQLIRHHTYAGFKFFSNENMRAHRSRLQSLPPYKGRVFVTSERPWGFRGYCARVYSVRCIKPCGRIATLDRFDTRYDAHAYAKAYAAENFVRIGNKSIRLSNENKTA